MTAAGKLLRAVPGVELVELGEPAVGLQSVNLSVLPAHKRELQLRELEAARAAGVDALAAVYHSDHRELCAHERDWPFRIVNVLEIVGESMGLHQDDNYKRLKVIQDADAIIAHWLGRVLITPTRVAPRQCPLCPQSDAVTGWQRNEAMGHNPTSRGLNRAAFGFRATRIMTPVGRGSHGRLPVEPHSRAWNHCCFGVSRHVNLGRTCRRSGG